MRRAQITVHFGLCTCAWIKFPCIFGLTHAANSNYRAFWAFHVCVDQISMHFRLCRCAWIKFPCNLVEDGMYGASFRRFLNLHRCKGQRGWNLGIVSLCKDVISVCFGGISSCKGKISLHFFPCMYCGFKIRRIFGPHKKGGSLISASRKPFIGLWDGKRRKFPICLCVI